METYNVARKTTTPGYRPECTAPQTKAAADYDSWCYIHAHTLRRVRCRKEHSLIIAAVQRGRGNAALLLWFYWRQAWNITLPSLIVAHCPLGLLITHITMTLPKIMPCRCKLGFHLIFFPNLRMKLRTRRIDGATETPKPATSTG